MVKVFIAPESKHKHDYISSFQLIRTNVYLKLQTTPEHWYIQTGQTNLSKRHINSIQLQILMREKKNKNDKYINKQSFISEREASLK